MSRRKRMRIAAFIMSVACLLTACDKEYPDAPELIEPKSANESYRTVEYGDIGYSDVRLGMVVPTEYCHFWTTSVKVSEIKVDIGDKVNAGDVLAVADIDAAAEIIEELTAQLELAQSVNAENNKKYELQKQELTYKLMGCQELGDIEGADSITVQISVLEENHRYDNLLYQHNVDRINDDIAKQQEIIENGTLVARSDGYVSYIKDISNDNRVNNSNNVVVISDYDDCYVEMQDETVNSDILSGYSTCYANVNGKKCNLVEYKYSDYELLIAQSRVRYPKIRLKFEDSAVTPQAGVCVPIMLQKEMTEHVLLVGNDSLYEDEKGSFVYVRNGDAREARYVELGESDAYNSEVVSGLEEGESVFYASESVLPENYEEYTAEATTYREYENTKSYVFENTQKLRYYSDYEAQVEELLIKQGSEVGVGDLICTIRTNEGSAELKEMSNSINNYKLSYEQACKDFDSLIADLETQMAECLSEKDSDGNETDTPEDREPEPEGDTATATDGKAEDDQGFGLDGVKDVATDTDADGKPKDPYLYEELSCQMEQVKIDKKIAYINYIYQLKLMEAAYAEASCNNDGTGRVMIYADKAGVLTNVNVKPGMKIKIGDRLFNIEVPAKEKTVLRGTSPMALNLPVTFTEEETGKVYEGKVSGTTGATGGQKFYFTTLNDKVYLTESVAATEERFYITVDDEAFYENNSKCVANYSSNIIEDAVVLSRGMVFSEVNPHTLKEEYYVWKVVNGDLVKQYVTLMSTIVNSEIKFCIISGVKPGDVIAREKSPTEVEE